jgi:hypothetical protein
MVQNTTTNVRNDLIEMFLDGTAGEAYANGRLKTVEDDESGNIQLVAYHESVLAEVTPDGKEVTLFTGHFKAQSRTVTRYIRALGRLLNQRENREVTVLAGHAPTTGYGRCSGAAQYIGEYTSLLSGNLSGAEKKAFKEVNRSLARHL